MNLEIDKAVTYQASLHNYKVYLCTIKLYFLKVIEFTLWQNFCRAKKAKKATLRL